MVTRQERLGSEELYSSNVSERKGNVAKMVIFYLTGVT